MFEPVLMKRGQTPGNTDIDVYMKAGGYEAVKKALKEHQPDELIEIVKASGLRGRGGAGFPCGLKWSFVPKAAQVPAPRYLAVNADEGEPGTFKDHWLLLKDPHQLLEGIIIAGFAIQLNDAYIYIRGEFAEPIRLMKKAIAEAKEKGFLGQNILGAGFSMDCHVVQGAGAYICGEETAMLTSIEGGKGNPKLKPPFPAVKGLWGRPTVINNVETLSCVPHIIERGAEWFAGIGKEKNTGPKMYCISGHVNRPGLYELPMGVNLLELINEYAGGIPNGRKLKAVIPGGSSSPVLKAGECDVPMTFDALAAAGTMLGSAATMVLDETTNMVQVARVFSHFYMDESCGQCTPCREGTGWLYNIFKRVLDRRATEKDLDDIVEICGNMKGRTICPLSDAAAMPLESYIKKFRDEFVAHINEGQGAKIPAIAAF